MTTDAVNAAKWLHARKIGVFGPVMGMKLVDIANAIPDDGTREVLLYRDALRYCADVAVVPQGLVIAEVEQLVRRIREEP